MMVRFNLAQANKYPASNNKMADKTVTMHSQETLQLQCNVIERILRDKGPFRGYKVAIEIGGENVANYLADRKDVNGPPGHAPGCIACIEKPRKKPKLAVHDTESD